MHMPKNIKVKKPLTRVKGGSALFAKIGGKTMRIGNLSPRGMAALKASKKMRSVRFKKRKMGF